MTARRSVDVSALPDFAFGAADSNWWGTIGFIAIEGMTLALAVISYFYLSSASDEWPPSTNGLPDLFVPTINLAILLASVIPMVWVHAASERLERGKVITGLIICDLLGVAFCILRIFEFGAFHVRWDTNAYGSVVWTTLGLHTFHIATEVLESIIMTICVMTHRHPKFLGDANDNCYFWYFVVVGWVIVYGVLFIYPRIA